MRGRRTGDRDVVAVWCGELSMPGAGVRDTWQLTSSSMH